VPKCASGFRLRFQIPKKITIETTRRRNLGLAKVLLANMCIWVSAPDPEPKKNTIETTRRRNLGLAKVLLANMCIWVSAPDPEPKKKHY
jgi:hypothetical protein